MIAIGIEKSKLEKVDNIAFIRATPHDDAFAEAPYDAVLAYNFIHLTEDVPATLARLRMLLKPGGLLISKTPALGGKRFLFGPIIAAMRMFGKAPAHVHMFTPKQLAAMMRNAGFEIIETDFHGDARPFIVARRR